MAQAEINNSITSRRRFLTVAAAASAVSAGALAAAAMPTLAASLDDSELVRLEEEIFEQQEGADAFNEEMNRLSDIWIAETKRLADEFYEGRSTLTPKERWELVEKMPECIEHARLAALQNAFYERLDACLKQMWATPARTPEGRRAKVTVLLGIILDVDWRRVDEETDSPELTARNLLIEFVGGEPGEMLRGQFV